MVTWEYQSFLINGPDLQETLNHAGGQGWELVSVTPTTYRYEDSQTTGLSGMTPTQWGATEYRVVLKRPVGQAG
ncbi:MAG TPA: hypothetical protein VF808_18595 [Ktedonobacterales bacterium]